MDDEWAAVAEISPKACWSISAGEKVHAVEYVRCAQPSPERLRLHGTVLTAADHTWCITDEIGFESGMVRIARCWRHAHDQPQVGVHLCLPVRIRPGKDVRIMMPGINYNNNPNADPKRVVPRFADELPTWGLYEEHRYPVPMVHFEWGKDGARARISLVTKPSSIAYGVEDQWWSLGAKMAHDHTDLLVTSGIVVTNERFGAVYGKQNTTEHYDDPSLDVPGRAEIEKTAYLDVGRVERIGYGFAQTLRHAYEIFQPSAEAKRSSAEVIELKTQAAKARYHEDGDVAGFLCLPEKNVYSSPPYFLWGWTGQSLRMAWCLLQLGRESGDGELTRQAGKAIDFFVQGQPADESALPCLRYLVNEGKWEADEMVKVGSIVSSRQLGEAMNSLADVLALQSDKDSWREMYARAVQFLATNESLAADGLYPRFWHTDRTVPIGVPTGTAGVFCVSPLVKGAALLGEDALVDRAVERLDAYFVYNVRDLKTPYWGGTLDACCEEKEAAIGFMRAALDVYDATQDRKFLDWARMAAEWILTFVYCWDTGFREGTPCQGRMATTGWCSVSVQNQHIDVFTPCVEFLRLGEAAGEERFTELGRMLFNAITQSIAGPDYMWTYDDGDKHSVVGEQAEQFFQTNYGQGRMTDRSVWRGGINTWNPSWIIAHVLWQAIEMKKRGL